MLKHGLFAIILLAVALPTPAFAQYDSAVNSVSECITENLNNFLQANSQVSGLYQILSQANTADLAEHFLLAGYGAQDACNAGTQYVLSQIQITTTTTPSGGYDGN